VYRAIDVNSVPAYEVENDGRLFLVHGTEEIGLQYDLAFGPKEIDGKLAYIAVNYIDN
jgi:hypothetical protein